MRTVITGQVFEAAVEIASLVEYPGNPRRGDVPAIAESIQANGFFRPLVAQRSTRRVLAGNHRMIAARACGMTTLPVWWVECDDETARKVLFLDNAVADAGGYDAEKEAELLALCDLDPAGIRGTGYSPADLQAITDRALGAVDQSGELGRARWWVIAELPGPDARAALHAELAVKGYGCKPMR